MDSEFLLTSTRSARKALDLQAPVDMDVVRDCLRIAFQAANGSNQQSWRWIVVRDVERRRILGQIYHDAYVSMTGGTNVAELFPEGSEARRVMSSTEWLVEHMSDVPLMVIPCYEPYLPEFDDDEAFQAATLYGSIFPAVWNFQLALHTRGYGMCVTTMHLLRQSQVRELLGIPDSYVQGCLIPVGQLRRGRRFAPASRRPVDEVVALDAWDGPSL
jgi:nitroreductase